MRSNAPKNVSPMSNTGLCPLLELFCHLNPQTRLGMSFKINEYSISLNSEDGVNENREFKVVKSINLEEIVLEKAQQW